MKYTLDITKEHCPMTFVRTKLKLAQIEEGDILEVLLSEGEPLENVPKSASEQGFQVLAVEHVEATTYRVTIKKITLAMGDNIHHSILENVKILSEVTPEEKRIIPHHDAPLPSIDSLRKIVELVKAIVFPGFFENEQVGERVRSYYIGVNVETLHSLLKKQIACGFIFCNKAEEDNVLKKSALLAEQFIDSVPEIKRLLYTDVEAIFNNDPAVSNPGEVIFCYPVVQAMVHYRIARELLRMGIPIIPRIITEMAHSATGIDIHPGAQIGEYFSIDHGTGIVIGETCIIGNHVTLYQGVTLGAKSFKLGINGKPTNIPRHPVLEDNVTVYSNSTILGRVTIGHDSVIGGNVWLTNSLPPYSKLTQGKYISTPFTDGLGI